MRQHIFNTDYSSDFLRWNSLFETIKHCKIKGDFNQELEDIQKSIIDNDDAALAYYFACDIGYKSYKMQAVILKAKAPKYALLFAQNIKNADIPSLQNLVLESKNIKYICRFGCFVNKADKKKIENMVLSENNAKYAHMLIKYIDGINLNKFKKIIMDCKNPKPRYLYELAKHLTSKKEISKIEDLIIACKSASYIRLFAKNIKHANIEKLEEAILQLGDIENIKKFANSVKKSKMKNFVIMI